MSVDIGEAGPQRLFVYGTLRGAARGPLQVDLMRGWVFEGFGRVAAQLFDFGAYPGAVPSGGDPAVVGEVYRALASTEALAALDHHEGEQFRRTLVSVALDGGGETSAWIYWYRGDERGRRVPSGDYLAHRSAGVAGT